MTGSTARWEAVCRRCGRCCHEKIIYHGTVHYTRTPCRYLDQQTSNCRVYRERETLQPECVRLTPEIVRAGMLPPDCPYLAFVDKDPQHSKR
ncbi:MAG: YkgJ family cysteine cluster protein [Pelovirga sp.]